MKTVSISGKSKRSGRVSRGSGWDYAMKFACRAYQIGWTAEDRDGLLGFRCCWIGR